MITMGIDLGAKNIKVVILKDNKIIIIKYLHIYSS